MLKEWQKAEEFYDLSLAIKTRLNDTVGAADTIWRKAKLYQEQERYQEALDLMAQTIAMLEKVNYHKLDEYRTIFNDMLRSMYTE
jgi:uncharacterized protein HemY